MPRKLYLIGTLHWQTEARAKELALSHAPALAAQEANGTWSVYYLDRKSRQPQQADFERELKPQDLFVKAPPADKPTSKPKGKMPWALS